MRTWHRWCMTVLIVTLSYWVVSGLLIAIYDVTDPVQVWAIEGGGPGARLTDWTRSALPIPDPTELSSGVARALASIGTFPIASVDVRMTGAVTRLQLADASGDLAHVLRFYAASGRPMTQAVADGNLDSTDPLVNRRNNLKSWHRGNVAGLTGQFIGLLTGLGLIALVITGSWLYCQQWNARRRSGHPQLFWSARESLWRRLHRCVAIVAAVFILNIAVTGVILAWGEWQLHVFLTQHWGFAPYPRPTPLPPVSQAALPRTDIEAMLQRAWDSAAAAAPGARIDGIDLVVRDGVAKALVTLGGPSPHIFTFDAVTGALAPDWSNGGIQVGQGYFADWHQVVKRMHRGDIVGSYSGRYIDLAAGFCLLYLVVSAYVMYFDLRRRRAQQARTGWFWR